MDSFISSQLLPLEPFRHPLRRRGEDSASRALTVEYERFNYAATRTRSLRTMTSPLVILGSFGIISLSFSSRTHVATSFVDSVPCSVVSKRLIELKMPLPASMSQ